MSIGQARLGNGNENPTVYGVLTHSYTLLFVCMRGKGYVRKRLSANNHKEILLEGGRNAWTTLVSLLARCMHIGLSEEYGVVMTR